MKATLKVFTNPFSNQGWVRTVEIDPENLKDAHIAFNDDGEVCVAFDDPSLIWDTKQGRCVLLRFKEEHPLYGLSVYAIPDDNWYFNEDDDEPGDNEPVDPSLIDSPNVQTI